MENHELVGANFGPEAELGHFSSKMNQERRSLSSIAIVIGPFSFTKIKEEDIGNVWLQQDGATCQLWNDIKQKFKGSWSLLYVVICTLFANLYVTVFVALKDTSICIYIPHIATFLCIRLTLFNHCCFTIWSDFLFVLSSQREYKKTHFIFIYFSAVFAPVFPFWKNQEKLFYYHHIVSFVVNIL